MTNWEYKIESVNALDDTTQRFIIALYPDGVLFERSNIDIPTAQVTGLTNGALIDALTPNIQELISEVSINYDAQMAALSASAPIQEAVNNLPDELISIS